MKIQHKKKSKKKKEENFPFSLTKERKRNIKYFSEEKKRMRFQRNERCEGLYIRKYAKKIH